jgi:hypothetical protein
MAVRSGAAVALGAVAAMAAVAAVGSRRGSFQQVTPFIQALLRIRNEYGADPEVVIRAQDFVLRASIEGVQVLAGTDGPTSMLEDEATNIPGPGGLLGYMDFQAGLLRAGRYYVDTVSRALPTHESRYQRFIPWIAREVARMVRAERAKRSKDQQSLIADLAAFNRELPRIADYAGTARPNLLQMTWPQAKEASDRWHTEMQEVLRQRAEKAKLKALKQGGRVIHRFPNGWTIQELYTKAHLDVEGDYMHHCVGSSTHYWNEVQRGNYKIVSLRRPTGESMLTITVQLPGNTILYALGHFDRAAGTRERVESYAPGIAKMLTDEMLLDECRALLEYQQMLTPGAQPTGHLARCAERVHAAEEKARRQLAARQGGPQGRHQGRRR